MILDKIEFCWITNPAERGEQILSQLILLSKEELLDTKEVKHNHNGVKVAFPITILSNLRKDDFDTPQISIINKRQTETTQRLIERHIEAYTPLLTGYLEDKFGKPLERLTADIEKDL